MLTRAESLLCFTGKGALFYRAVRTRRPEYTAAANLRYSGKLTKLQVFQIVGTTFDLNPFQKDVLFLFCGKRCDRIKGLLWEGTGFLPLYKRLEQWAFSWPKTPEAEEAREIDRNQYQMLMMGLNPIHPKIREVHPQGVS